ncbi:MAG: extracellular solute-binding protein [Eubacteriales bacterium]|nr:extracellular solute-binding protein [Eubacteriales bacterium]
MKKKLVALLIAFVILWAGAACADGVVLKTVSIFAGNDAAADTYAGLLKGWEEATGNTLNDYSAASDEAWKLSVLKDFAAGNEADVLFFFAQTADSQAILKKVVPIAEINAAYPELQLTEDKSIAETDGKVYAIPVRPYWEGLFCNTDLFESYGLELPTTWEQFKTAVEVFRQHDVVPIAVSLSDVPHYMAEFCISVASTAQEQEARPTQTVPEGWIAGMKLLRELYEMNAFSADVNATTSSAANQLFIDKKAAMQVDGSWFANSLPALNMETTAVLPFPSMLQSEKPAYLFGVSMGFYLSRSAWDDPTRRDAAVDLLRYLTTGDNAAALGVYNISDQLLASYHAMVEGDVRPCAPIQDAMRQDARGKWFSLIPGIADGTVEPEQMWEEVMEMRPFSE